MSNAFGKPVSDALSIQDKYTPLANLGEDGTEPKFAEYQGTAGDDIFEVWGGSPLTITGGGGADTYVFGREVTVEVFITDFDPADDLIDFTRNYNPYTFDDFEISDDGEGNAFIWLKSPYRAITVTLVGVDWQEVNSSHLHTYATVTESEVGGTTHIGTDGEDYFRIDSDGNTISGGGEHDYFWVRGDNNEISGGDGADEIMQWYGDWNSVDGGRGDDSIWARGDHITVSGGDGDDAIALEGNYITAEGGAGADHFSSLTFYRREGNWVTYKSGSQGVTLNLVTGGTSGDAEGDTYSNIYNVEGTQYSDILDASGHIRGVGMLGRRGADKLFGGSANDSLYGGHDNDFIQAGAGNDIVGGGTGDDEIYSKSYGNDTIRGDDGDDVIGGGGGNDILIGDGSDAGYFSSRTLNAHGSDTIFGGDGNDTIVGANWKDNGNGQVEAEEVITSAEDGANQLWAGAQEDVLYGGGSDDTMGGGYGDDTLHGLNGNDTLYGGKAHFSLQITSRDDLFGDAGDDLIYAGSSEDNVWGGDGDDTLYGGNAADTIDGGAGADILWGGAGADDITGGTGADYFSFVAGHGEDTVHDFNVDEDTLNLAGVAAGFTSAEDVDAAITITTIDGVEGALIDTGDGDSIFLVGVRLRDLEDIDYIF